MSVFLIISTFISDFLHLFNLMSSREILPTQTCELVYMYMCFCIVDTIVLLFLLVNSEFCHEFSIKRVYKCRFIVSERWYGLFELLFCSQRRPSVARCRAPRVFVLLLCLLSSSDRFPSRSAVLLRLRIDPYLCLMQFGTDRGSALRIPDKPAGVKVDPARGVERREWVMTPPVALADASD